MHIAKSLHFPNTHLKVPPSSQYSHISPTAAHFIPTNANNCRLHSITSERIGNPELNAAMKCVHEYKFRRRKD